MSIALVRSRALLGLHSPQVDVEVHIGNGLPAFNIVGLPEAEVRESRERVRAALLHCGFEFPNRRLTVNLAPADLPKHSGRFDLPIAVGILVASGQVPPEHADTCLNELEFVGELSLTGKLRPVFGLLAMAVACQRDSQRALVVPHESAEQLTELIEPCAYSAENLEQVVAHLAGASGLTRLTHRAKAEGLAGQHFSAHGSSVDFAHIKGHAMAKHAMHIVASGGHSLLMLGPPGSGKSLLASALPSILGPLTQDKATEVMVLHDLKRSVSALAWGQRPVRSPHHSASAAALVGGGSPPRPGEVSLAHHGILFLDELPEFPRAALEALREPLETGFISISRASHQSAFPAQFQLIAAMNPCPCGYLGEPRCRCNHEQVKRYQARISGPLLDRIDLQIQIDPVSQEVLLQNHRATQPSSASQAQGSGDPASPTMNSQTMREQVMACQEKQWARQGKLNAHLDAQEIDQYCLLEPAAQHLLSKAAQSLQWSSRACHRVIRVARTIADLEPNIPVRLQANHIAQASSLRRALVGT